MGRKLYVMLERTGMVGPDGTVGIRVKGATFNETHASDNSLGPNRFYTELEEISSGDWIRTPPRSVANSGEIKE